MTDTQNTGDNIGGQTAENVEGQGSAKPSNNAEIEFLLSGDELAESFLGLVAKTDPQLIRIVFSNTALLFLANARGNSEEMSDEELTEVLVDSANQAYDLIVQELESIRDAKIQFAQGTLGFHS